MCASNPATWSSLWDNNVEKNERFSMEACWQILSVYNKYNLIVNWNISSGNVFPSYFNGPFIK